MTAIAIDYSPFGFAVAADSKGHWCAEDGTEREASREPPPAVTKIFKIQNHRRVMAYALAGTAFSDDMKFSLIAKARRSAVSLATLKFDGPRTYIRQFMIPIKEAYKQAKINSQFRSFPTVDTAQIAGGLFPIAHIFFAGYFDGEPFMGYGTVPHREQIVQDALVEVWTPTPGATPSVCGSSIVLRKLFKENDPIFARYLVPPRSDSSLEETAARVRGCIEAQCSDEAAAVDPFCREQVGGPVRVATVTMQKGFQWYGLRGAEDERRAGRVG
jgi:hypothetical protein